jgi:hypothetical protein
MSDAIEALSQATDEASAAAAASTAQRKILYDREQDRRAVKKQLDEEEQQRNAKPVKVETEEEFNQRPPDKFLVDGMIVEGSLVELVGPPGTMKTFLAIDLGFRIAAGHKLWLGQAIYRQGPVVYVLGEGAGRFKHRKDVWRQVFKEAGPLPVYVVARPLDLRNSEQVQQLVEQVKVFNPIVIFFDTRSRNLPGAEENSAKDMGEAIAACDLIKEATGATVVTLHHPTKDETTARGSGAWKGAVDLELWVKETNKIYELSVGKAKDADDSLTIHFYKEIHELAGVFENGQPVTSCVVKRATAQQVKTATFNLHRAILEFVHQNPGVNVTAVKTQFRGNSSNLTNVLGTLVSKGNLDMQPKGKSQQYKITALGLMELNS